MEREIIDKLRKWKESPNRKPLILWGARQVGKTWALKEFGRECFDDVVYISFYNNSRIAALFEKDYDTSRIIGELETAFHRRINPGKTLVIFDEIQGAPKVLESLKYFCEDAGEYAICAAGSLLGVALHQGVSFPVGKVDELHLYPMSFAEYLRAMGESDLADAVSDMKDSRLSDFRDRYIELLKTYYVTGGMPEVVREYRDNHDLYEVRQNQLAILDQYEGDFGKHITTDMLPRIRMAWKSIPAQLAKENRKFMYGTIKKGARAREYETALEWLEDAGLIYKVNKVSKPGVPLPAYVDQSSFKVYMNDIGLLGALSELDPESILAGSSAFTEFKGALTEQYVMQELKSAGKIKLYYFATEKAAYEVDFLIQKKMSVIPIEVKAETNLKAKSLRYYYDKYSPEYAYRLSMADYIEQGWLINVPLWAATSISAN